MLSKRNSVALRGIVTLYLSAKRLKSVNAVNCLMSIARRETLELIHFMVAQLNAFAGPPISHKPLTVLVLSILIMYK